MFSRIPIVRTVQERDSCDLLVKLERSKGKMSLLSDPDNKSPWQLWKRSFFSQQWLETGFHYQPKLMFCFSKSYLMAGIIVPVARFYKSVQLPEYRSCFVVHGYSSYLCPKLLNYPSTQHLELLGRWCLLGVMGLCWTSLRYEHAAMLYKGSSIIWEHNMTDI